MSKKPDARRTAALAIRDVVVHQHSLDNALAEHSAGLADNDAALAQALAFGVLRHYQTLATGIDALLEKPVRRKDFAVYALMLIGAWQLQAMRMPPYAAIDSVVRASKALKKPWASGLINAVLRRFQKTPDTPFDEQVASEHPDWLYRAIQQAWPEQAGAIFAANNQQPPLCLRINCRQTSRQDYLQQLTQAGINATAGRFSADAVYLADKPADITALPGFADGFFSVQDEAPQLAAMLLNAEPGMHILDACAAPGGKTCHILERLDNRAELVAVDIDPHRLERVRQNLDRLQLSATLKAADISRPQSWWDGRPFDRILADVPCSATGVIRRHPDIKLLRRADDIAALAERQYRILQTLWPMLAPGGILLYATCSILPQENSDIIARFLAHNNDAGEIAIKADCGIVSPHGRQLLPQTAGHDGFYYAALKKGGAP